MNRNYFFVKNDNSIRYQGINRLLFPGGDDFNEDFVLSTIKKIFDLNESDEKKAFNIYQSIRKLDNVSYDLITNRETNSQNWKFLGFDVAEVRESFWSAIYNRPAFMSDSEIKKNEKSLNQYGLFERKEDAKDFLKFYLKSDDPDKGCTNEGWSENPDWYAVIPVSKYIYENDHRFSS